MVGLLGIAVALLLGVAMKPACVAGVTMLVLMWSASLPPDQDIFMDNHIIYALLLVGLVVVGAGKTFGFGRQWAPLLAASAEVDLPGALGDRRGGGRRVTGDDYAVAATPIRLPSGSVKWPTTSPVGACSGPILRVPPRLSAFCSAASMSGTPT
jgi:hypothetical protein